MGQRNLRGRAINHVEGRLDDWTLAINRSAIKRDAKDVVETELDCIQRGEVGVTVEGSLGLIFSLLEQGQKFFDVRFVQDSARLPTPAD